VKVTDTPAQVGFVPVVCAMLTAGADGVDTVTVIELELAGLPITPLRFEVITQVIASPLAHADEL